MHRTHSPLCQTLNTPDYHSLLVRIEVQRDQQQRPTHTTLRQSFTLVLRSPSSDVSSSSRDPPRPGVLSNITLTDLLGADAPRACPVAATSRLLLQLPQQLQARQLPQSPGLEEELLQLPAYTTAPAAEAADSTAGEGLAPAASSRASGSGLSRADSWSGPGFTLSPAPDAAAVLPPTDPGCLHSTTAATATATGSSGDAPEANGSSAAACVPLVFYLWDLHRSPQPPQNPGATVGGAAAGAAVPFSVAWQQQAAAADPAAAANAAAGNAVELSAATAAAAPQFLVSRFITGTGQLHGGMVLQLTAVQASDAGHRSSPAVGSSSSSGSNMSVCILQVVPWYIRLWLHTLRLSIDGQVRRLRSLQGFGVWGFEFFAVPAAAPSVVAGACCEQRAAVRVLVAQQNVDAVCLSHLMYVCAGHPSGGGTAAVFHQPCPGQVGCI